MFEVRCVRYMHCSFSLSLIFKQFRPKNYKYKDTTHTHTYCARTLHPDKNGSIIKIVTNENPYYYFVFVFIICHTVFLVITSFMANAVHISFLKFYSRWISLADPVQYFSLRLPFLLSLFLTYIFPFRTCLWFMWRWQFTILGRKFKNKCM